MHSIIHRRFKEANIRKQVRIPWGRLALSSVVLGGLIGTSLAQTSTLVSRASGLSGVLGNGDSPLVGAKISGNGQFVVFRSNASNLVAGDTNGFSDVFVRDTSSPYTTTRVSIATGGAQSTGGNSNNPCISHDGRFVAFSSSATNLVPGGTSGSHVFLHDRQTGQTSLVSIGSDGASPGDADSNSPSIWSTGAFVKVAFRSLATNLVGNDLNGLGDVFVRDMSAGATTLVSIATDGWSGNGDSGITQTSISGDGKVVGFSSSASNLVASDTNGATSDVFTRNLDTNTTTLISKNSAGAQGASGSYSAVLNYNGSIVAFSSYNGLVSGDTNGVLDVFVRDTNTSTTSRVSIANGSNGAQGNAASGNSNGWGIAISGDGNRVLFQSLATNLVKKDTNGFEDIFLRTRSSNSIVKVSVTPSGGLTNGSSGGLNTCGVSISANGQYAMFASYATNVVSGDGNGFMDVFRRGPY